MNADADAFGEMLLRGLAGEELAEIVAGTGWTIARTLDGDDGNYCVVLEKEPSRSSTSQSRTGRIPR